MNASVAQHLPREKQEEQFAENETCSTDAFQFRRTFDGLIAQRLRPRGVTSQGNSATSLRESLKNLIEPR